MLGDIPKDVLLATRAPLALFRADMLSSYARYVSRLSGGAVSGSGGASCSASTSSSSSSASSAGPGGGAGGSGGPHQAAAPHSREIGAAAAVLFNILCVVDHLCPGPEAILGMAGHSDGGAAPEQLVTAETEIKLEAPCHEQVVSAELAAELTAELLDALGRSQLLEHAAAAVLRLAAACPPPPPPTPTAAEAAIAPAGKARPRHPPTSEKQTAVAAAAAEAVPHPWLCISRAAVQLSDCLQLLLLPAVTLKREDLSQQPNGMTAASSPASSGVLYFNRPAAVQAKRLARGPCAQYFALWLAGCARASIESLASGAGSGAAAIAVMVGTSRSGTGGTAGAEAFAANRQSPPQWPRREVSTTGTAGLAPPLLPFAVSNPADAALNAAGAVFTFLRVFQATVGVGGGPRIIGSQPLHQPASQQQQQQPLRCRRLGITTPYPPVAVYAFLERHHNAFWTAGQSPHFAPIAEPLTTRWTPLMQTLLLQLTPEQAAARLPGLWRLLVMQLGGAEIEGVTAGQVFLLLKHPRVHPAGSPQPPSQPRAPALADAAAAADAATAANTSDSWPSLSARCALDAGLLPALERALRRPWHMNGPRWQSTFAVLELMARGLRRSGAWPAFVAHAPVHEVVGLVVTVELRLKDICPGTAWLYVMSPGFNQSVPEDARLLSDTAVALLEQLVAACDTRVQPPPPPPPLPPLPPPPPQELQQQGPRSRLQALVASAQFQLVLMLVLLLVGWMVCVVMLLVLLAWRCRRQRPGGRGLAAAETVAGGRRHSTSSTWGEHQVDHQSCAAASSQQQQSGVGIDCSTSSMEEFEDLAAMAGPLWYNNIDQQRSRDRMRLSDLAAAGGAPPAGSAAAAQQVLLTSFAMQRWLLVLFDHASRSVFVAPTGAPVPVNGISWTLAHRLALVRLLTRALRHMAALAAGSEEAKDAGAASAARLAWESWHAEWWGTSKTSAYGLVRALIEGSAVPGATERPQGEAGEELALACLDMVEAFIAANVYVQNLESPLNDCDGSSSSETLGETLRLLAVQHGRAQLMEYVDAACKNVQLDRFEGLQARCEGVTVTMLRMLQQQSPAGAQRQQQVRVGGSSWLLSPAEVEARLRQAGVVLKGVGSRDGGTSGGSSGAAATPACGAFTVCGNPVCSSSLDGPSALIAPGRGKTCARCKQITYCCGACQLKHWREGGHDKACAGLAAAGAGAAAAAAGSN